MLLTFVSCSVGPAYVPPSTEIPFEWKNKKNEADESSGKEKEETEEMCYLDYWWQVFKDDRLNELQNQALTNNPDLYIAFKRTQEARALVGIAAADFYPQLTLNPLFTNTDLLIKANGGSSRNVTAATGASLINTKAANTGSSLAAAASSIKDVFRVHQLLYFLPFDLNYEVDLWGKIRDRYRAAVYNWKAQQKDYEVVMLNLTSNLAVSYYQLRTLDNQLDLLKRVLQTRQKAYEINNIRYEEGITNYSDVTLAAEDVDSATSLYEEVTRQRALLEDRIAVLIGVPSSEFTLEHLPLEGAPPEIPAGIPSEILLRRPDIAEAELMIKSQHESVKEAYSQFFPSLNLTAVAGFESPVLKDFLKGISRYWMNGEQINQIVFDGNRTFYQFNLQIARFQEANGVYQQQVLLAFQDVEDSLASIESYAKQYEAMQGTVHWAQKTYQIYSDRYSLGVVYYIDVANSERDLLNFQINLNAIQGLRFVATIGLIRALGGGW